jgi:ABC-type Na+ efflux pump permease subunit
MEEARPLLELIMSIVAFFLPLLVLMAFIWSFASLPVVKEKVNGNIECLLATPASPGALLGGKCLAVFLPGFGLAVAATLVALTAVNLLAVFPAAGYFVLPPAALFTGLVTTPLIMLGLLAFTLLFSLAGSPEIAIAPSFIVGFGLMMGLPVGIATGAVDLASCQFALWYFAGAAAVWAAVGFLSRVLTRENIVLSGRG